MRLLLDTHYLIGIAKEELARSHANEERELREGAHDKFVSVASIWEIAIKSRLGKLDAGVPVDQLAELAETFGFTVLDITRSHVVADLDPKPNTRDPFDRLLLAQCQVEGMRLVTFDRALNTHPLAWRNEKPAPVSGSGLS